MMQMHVPAFRFSVNPLPHLSSLARLRSLAHLRGKDCCWPRCCYC